MKLISSRVYVCLMMLFALFCSAQTAMADNVLTVKPFSVDGAKAVNVPVILDNSDAITQIQFDVVLPSFLVLDKSGPIKNNDRLTQHQLKYDSYLNEVDPETGVKYNRYRILVFSLQGDAVQGNSGEIMSLPIKTKEDYDSGNTEMTVKNIVMTNKAAETITSPAVTVEVSMLNCSVYTQDAQFVVNPGATKSLTICVDNNFDAYGVEFEIAVPEGFTVNCNTFVTSDRCSDDASPLLKYIDKLGAYRFLLSGFTKDAIIAKGEGAILTVDVTAPADFTGETESAIAIKNCVLSYVLPGTIEAVGVTAADVNVPVVNGKIAYDKANEVVEALKADLAAALETIETECPDVKDQFTGVEISDAISELVQAIEAAYADGTLTPNYDEVMAPAEGIGNDITALVTDAKAAQLAYVNDAAYQATLDQIAGLQSKLDEAKAKIAKEYPGVDVSEYLNQAQAGIDEVSKAAEEAYNAANENGETYAYEFDAEPIEIAIADAVAQAERLSSAEGAYAQAIKQIDALQEQLNITKTVVAVQYPGVDVAAKTKAAQDAIDAAREAAEEALEAAQTEGSFDYEVPVDDITALINGIPAEAKRLVDNEAAYNDAIKTIDQLEKKLDATYDNVVAEYPEVSLEDIKAAVDAAKAAIAEARTDANDAYIAVMTEGNYDYEVPVDEIEALIKEIRIAAENAGIDDVIVDAENEDVRMFNLQGVEVENPAPGSVVIIRTSKGATRKVIVM